MKMGRTAKDVRAKGSKEPLQNKAYKAFLKKT